MLLEIGYRLLDQVFLVMQETELESGISLSLSLVLGLGDVHQLAQVVDGHLHVAVLGMHVRKKFVRLALLVARTLLDLALADLEETGQTSYRFV